MPQNKLVVIGQRSSKEKYATAVAVYDLNTGKEDYSFTLGEPGKVTVGAGMQPSGSVLLLKDYLIVPTTKGLVAKKAQTGEVLWEDRKSTRLNSSHVRISYAVFCLKKKKKKKKI